MIISVVVHAAKKILQVVLILICLAVVLSLVVGRGLTTYFRQVAEIWVEDTLSFPTLEVVIGNTTVSAPSYLGGRTQVCYEAEYWVVTNQVVAHSEATSDPEESLINRAKAWVIWQAEGREDKIRGLVLVRACSLLNEAQLLTKENEVVLYLPQPEYSAQVKQAESELVRGGIIISALDFMKKEGAQQVITEEARQELEEGAIRASNMGLMRQGVAEEARVTVLPLMRNATEEVVSRWARSVCLENHSPGWCHKAEAHLLSMVTFKVAFIGQ